LFTEDQDQMDVKRRRIDSWNEGGQRRGPPQGAHAKPREYNYSRHGGYDEDRDGHGSGSRGQSSYGGSSYRGRGYGRRPGGSRGHFRASRGQY
jgi:hypothetical protein